MKRYRIKKDWCSVTLFNKASICLQFEFNSSQIDLIMFGFQLRQGIAGTFLGITLGIEWQIKRNNSNL
jgi:hypothetical protein|tara:strand:+ start:342 stop:545 length:204 start_codon:yes stop_codon:yes gene_type:complete